MQVPWSLFLKHVCNNLKRNFELWWDQSSARHDWKNHTLTLWHILFKGLFHLIVCLLVLNCWDNGPWIISNWVAASSFKIRYSLQLFLNWKKIYHVIAKVPIIVCGSFVFWGLYCNYIVTKLFQCSTVIMFMIETTCYLC